MNKDLKKLYTCTLNNRVVVFDTNYAAFHLKIRNYEPLCYSTNWMNKKFKEKNEFTHVINDKAYHFQQLV